MRRAGRISRWWVAGQENNTETSVLVSTDMGMGNVTSLKIAKGSTWVLLSPGSQWTILNSINSVVGKAVGKANKTVYIVWKWLEYKIENRHCAWWLSPNYCLWVWALHLRKGSAEYQGVWGTLGHRGGFWAGDAWKRSGRKGDPGLCKQKVNCKW